MLDQFSGEIVYLVSNIFCIYATNCFFECFLEKRKYSPRYFKVSYAIYFVVTSVSYLIYGNLIVNVIVHLLSLFLLTCLYRRSLSRRILAAVLIYGMAMISESVASYIFSIISDQVFNNLLQKSHYKAMILTTSCLIYFMLIKSTTYFINKRGEVDIPVLYWMAIFTIPMGSMVTLHALFTYSIVEENESIYGLNMVAVVSIIIINCIVFYLYDKLLLDTATKTQNIMLEQQMEYYEKQYEETENMQKEVSSIRHDMKNQLIGIQGYLKDADYSSLENHLETLLGEIEQTKILAYSGNAVIDNILYHKIARAKKADIPVELELKIPQTVEVDHSNFCILLGNALDNAIEACLKLQEQERKIMIRMGYEHRALYMEVSNPYKGELNYDSRGDLVSSKAEKKNHGIGLKRIKKVIEAEDDFMDIDSENQMFKLKILLFDKSESRDLMVG